MTFCFYIICNLNGVTSYMLRIAFLPSGKISLLIVFMFSRKHALYLELVLLIGIFILTSAHGEMVRFESSAITVLVRRNRKLSIFRTSL